MLDKLKIIIGDNIFPLNILKNYEIQSVQQNTDLLTKLYLYTQLRSSIV